jgi:hypothetical protein
VRASGAEQGNDRGGAIGRCGRVAGGGPDDPFGWDALGESGAGLSEPGDPRPRALEDMADVLARVEPLSAAELLAVARRFLLARQVRDEVFGNGEFLNPGWNILLELFIAGEEGRNVTIKSACVAACVPQSTALRHIAHLIDVQLAARAQHPSDARSAYLKLTEPGRMKMVAFLSLSAAGRDAPGA